MGMPPEVRVALLAVLIHVEPGWEHYAGVLWNWLEQGAPDSDNENLRQQHLRDLERIAELERELSEARAERED